MFKPFAALALLLAPAFAYAQSPAIDAARAAAADYDNDGARAIVSEACDNGDAAACRALLATLNNSYSDDDEAASRTLASTMCDNGDLLACVTLVRYAERGRGGDIDQSLQRSSAVAACRGGMLSACTTASSMAGQGEGGPQDRALSLEMVQLGCEGGNAISCQFLGARYQQSSWDENEGEDVEASWIASRAAYARGCELGDVYSCSSLAEMMISGDGGEKDLEGGLALLERACAEDFYQCEPWLRALEP
ncbi:hypothetical protein [uncultured Erythrobacter sp.]|uniref:tetratricopeptide repeat protein n=1 Tax=uncultured Erythrobacter sp. TaxID=263913 RepID=UPI002613A95E|nr:hypothetical protein [uncultured Erythrobacter sp.]